MPKNKIVVSVPGVGNCFWEALQRAGIPVNVSKQRTPVFGDYKRATWEYYESAEFQRLLATLDPADTRLSALSGLDLQPTRADVEWRLTSEGAFATEPVFQLAALALKVDITVEDISRPGYQLGFYSGTPSGERAPEHVLLLLRNHGVHPVYNASFEPMTDGNNNVIRSSGHVWLVVDRPQRQTAVQGNEVWSELVRP
jgi:hypothetical protein